MAFRVKTRQSSWRCSSSMVPTRFPCRAAAAPWSAGGGWRQWDRAAWAWPNSTRAIPMRWPSWPSCKCPCLHRRARAGRCGVPSLPASVSRQPPSRQAQRAGREPRWCSRAASRGARAPRPSTTRLSAAGLPMASAVWSRFPCTSLASASTPAHGRRSGWRPVPVPMSALTALWGCLSARLAST